MDHPLGSLRQGGDKVVNLLVLDVDNKFYTSLIHLWYHRPGVGGVDKFYFRPSRLLAHRNQQVLSGMDWAPEVYSKIFPRLTGHGCHA